MGKIKVEDNCNGIAGLKVIEPAVFGDARGYFMETYNYNDFAEAGIGCTFVQDNQSASKKGVLRGLHFQIHYPQDKLVRVVNGEVCRQRIRSSFLSPAALPMGLSYCQSMQSSVIKSLIFTTPMMRGGSCGKTAASGSNGLCRKGCQKRI